MLIDAGLSLFPAIRGPEDLEEQQENEQAEGGLLLDRVRVITHLI